jgi:hypothetical protein
MRHIYYVEQLMIFNSEFLSNCQSMADKFDKRSSLSVERFKDAKKSFIVFVPSSLAFLLFFSSHWLHLIKYFF